MRLIHTILVRLQGIPAQKSSRRASSFWVCPLTLTPAVRRSHHRLAPVWIGCRTAPSWASEVLTKVGLVSRHIYTACCHPVAHRTPTVSERAWVGAGEM